MQGLSPLALLLSGLGQRDDVVTGTDNQGNLVVMPKPGAAPKLPGGVGTAPVAAPPQAAPVMSAGQNPYAAAAQPAPAMMPGAAAASPAAMPGAAAAPPATPTVNAPAAPQYSALPTPPTYAPTDMARWQGLQASVVKDSKPTDPNDPAAKTHWYDRLLGGLVGFGRGYVHDPNAIREGGAVTNRRYNTAEALREKRLEGDKSALDNFDKSEAVRQRDFQSQQSIFEDEYKNAQEERQRFDTGSKATEREAKANKYDNALDPTSGIPDKNNPGQWLYRSYGDPEGAAPSHAGKPPKGATGEEPKTYEQTVVAAELEKDPERKAALQAAAKKMEQSERRKFQAGKGGDGETPATKLRRSQAVNRANDTRQKQLKEAESDFGPALRSSIPGARDRAAESLRQAKQQAEDSYAQAIEGYGTPYSRVIYNKDGSFTREGESASTPAKGGTTEEGRVRVKDKSGKLFTVPQSQLSKALKQGYTKE